MLFKKISYLYFLYIIRFDGNIRVGYTILIFLPLQMLGYGRVRSPASRESLGRPRQKSSRGVSGSQIRNQLCGECDYQPTELGYYSFLQQPARC